MKCDSSKQKKIINAFIANKPSSLDGVLEIMRQTVGEEYTIDQALSEFAQGEKNAKGEIKYLKALQVYLKSIGYDVSKAKERRKIAKINKNVSDISSVFTSPLITNLFDTFHVAENYFKRQFNSRIIESIIINRDVDLLGRPITKYVTSDLEISNNIKVLKNNLFKEIVDYLVQAGKITDITKYYKDDSFIGKLYDSKGIFQNYDLYKETIKLLETHLSGENQDNLLEVTSNKTIVNLKGNIRSASHKPFFDVYNAAVTLVNFDNIIAKYYSNILKVNYSSFNNFEDPVGNLKYKLNIKGKSTEYWKNEEHQSESVEEILSDLTKSVVETIEHVNKKGEFTGFFLDIKDLYSLASFIKNFETINFNYLVNARKEASENKAVAEEKKEQYESDMYEEWVPFSDDPLKMIKWYINKIIKASESNFKNDKILNDRDDGVSFANRIDILKSLENFINKLGEKEENSPYSVLAIITQVLNNSYGATYNIYNAETGQLTVQEMHSHNATRIDLQNSIYSHLLKNSANLNNYFPLRELSKEGEVTLIETNDPESQQKELDQIEKLTDSDSKLSSFIFKTLGIYIGKEGAAELREKWGNDKVPSSIRSYLIEIRKGDGENINLFQKIKNNEDNKAERIVANIKTDSEVISEVLSSIQDIMDVYLSNYVLRPIMTTTTLTGEKIPTFKLANLMYDDVNVLSARLKIETENPRTNFKSLFLKYGGLLGTTTKLEIINDDQNKSAFDWNMIESFNSNFKYDFLNTFMPGSKLKGINVMIGNYSDKNSILTKLIDKHIKNFEGKNIIGGLNPLSMSDIIELFQNQSKNFYSDLMDDIYNQYKKLGVKGLESSKEKFSNNVKLINNFLQKFNKKEDLLNFINKKRQTDETINIVEELHYSYYYDEKDGNKKKIYLNQIILDNYQIYNNNNLFKQFILETENSLINKLSKETSELFSSKELSNLQTQDKSNKNKLNELLKTFGIDSKAIETFIKDEKMLISDSDGKLNPLLKRWLWTNNLFRNEYLFVTVKPEYMHPHKAKEGFGMHYRGDQEFNMDLYKKESSLRLPNMSKRNVSFTATYEIPIRNYRLGVPNNVNVAITEDYNKKLYLPNGKVVNQDVHDGSSKLSYAYAKMIEKSFPGNNYSGTKKQIGTFVTEFGSALKKDAEIVITNNRMRDSSKSAISLSLKNQQMLSAKQLPKIKSFIKSKLPISNVFYKNGDYFKINNYSIEDNILSLNLSKYNQESQKFERLADNQKIEVNTLYDIWLAFGAETTLDENLKWSEGSNELLYDLITSYNENGNYLLKENFIHVLSSSSSFKSGAVNLNPQSFWEGDGKLSYTTFESRYMGPQLDANHTADQSKIKEITQIISALAQNPTTASLAEEVYKDIARIIEESAKPYIDKMSEIRDSKVPRKTLEKYYRTLSSNFVQSLANSQGTNLAKTISEAFGKSGLLPFSNQHFFRNFVEDMITKMNNEFITRYYPGIGAILNPSHGIIQIYEGVDGKIYKQEELLKEAFNWYSFNKNNQEIISLDTITLIQTLDNSKASNYILTKYLETKFPPEDTEIQYLNPGDKVIIENQTEVQDLNDIYNYMRVKSLSPNTKVKRLRNVPRDLKPQEITFKINGINYNIFDTDSIKLQFLASQIEQNEELQKKGKKPIHVINEVYKNYLTQISVKYNLDTYQKTVSFLNAWTQRNLQLLDENKIMLPLSEITEQGIINFDKLFGEDKVVGLSYSNAKKYYTEGINVISVIDYKSKPAELILPNTNMSTFDIGDKTINEVDITLFKEKLEFEYAKDDFRADLKFNLKNDNSPVYVRYVNSLPTAKEDDKLFTYKLNNYDKLTKYRIGVDGQILYEIPSDTKLVHKDGVDLLYIKASNNILIEETNKKEDIIKDNIEQKINNLVSSFRGEISSIVPLMNNSNQKLIYNSRNIKGENKKLNEISFKIFSKYSDFKRINSDELNEEWFNNNVSTIIDQLSNKMFASWQKSLEFVAARIPAQSMQSFMEMKNVAYFNSESNDAYVSIWQILLQGSDFDIDKAYIMGYGFNKNGQYETPSSLFDYDSKQKLDAIERLPLPTLTESKVLVTDTDTLDNEFLYFIQRGFDFSKSSSEIASLMNEDDIKILAKVLRKVNESNLIQISKLNENNISLFTNFINEYNLDKDYVNKRNSVRNSIVSKIKQIISTPSNLLLAYEPVSISDIHKAADASRKKHGFSEDELNMFDIVSYFKQQENAAIGKTNVGIGANGMKVLFALSNYYNSWYNKMSKRLEEFENTNWYTDSKVFKKELLINDKKRIVHSIANVDIDMNQFNFILETYGYSDLEKQEAELSNVQAALLASGFVSAATDNAKELVLSKINAIIELSSMHLYLISLGYSMEDIAIYMNSGLGRHVAKEIASNMFINSPKKYVGEIITKYANDNEGSKQEVEQFRRIYEGAQEFKILASILKVNQKATANTAELNNFLSTLETAMFTREYFVLGKDEAKKLRNPENWTNLSEKIIRNNELLSSLFEKNKDNPEKLNELNEYIINVLNEANEITVDYIDNKGQVKQKVVSLIGGQFDFRYYLYPTNENYRQATINYYNLFKNTINIFDVIDKSPHFKAMINGVSTIHTVLSTFSRKYNFSFSTVRDLLRDNAEQMHSNNPSNIKTKFGDKSFPIKVTDNILGRSFNITDKFMVYSWLNSSEKVEPFRFNVRPLMKMANVTSLNFHSTEEAKMAKPSEVKSSNNIKGVIKINVNDTTEDDFIIDLKSEIGISNFKLLMENVILNILQENNVPLGSNLKITSVRNALGQFAPQITSTFPISSLNSPINMDKFQELLANFNEVDKVAKHKIVNPEGKWLPYKDLFYIYNLIINNESYGDKRLTPLFEDYIKNPESIGKNYIDFTVQVDLGDVDIFGFDIDQMSNEEVELKDKLIKDREQDLLFLLLHKNGRLKTPKGDLKIINGNFPILVSLSETSNKDSVKYQTAQAIMSILKNRNLIINFNCN